MTPTRTAYGTWNGGRFMHFGEALDEKHFIEAIHRAHTSGIRTFLTADVYGSGEADSLLGMALEAFPRDSYCLVGAIGHDFYRGERQGSKGFPRFTDPDLRQPSDFADYLRMAAEKSLERCRTDHFDCILLHNPDSIGYTHDAVWTGMERLREQHLTGLLGIAPGPANGFTLDILLCMDRFAPLLDWAMIILNPLEPWPGTLCLPGAIKNDVKLITRVVDYGGLFHDDVKPGHPFGPRDHRTFRPAGWVEAGNKKLEAIRHIADCHGLTMLQLACLWNLAHAPVESVVPTLIQEPGPNAKPLAAKIEELASLPDQVLNPDEVEEILSIGDNTGCMDLKGANPAHTTASLPDRWSLTPDLLSVAEKYGITPSLDLALSHAGV